MNPPKCKVCGNAHWGVCWTPGPAVTKPGNITQRQADKAVRDHKAKAAPKQAKPARKTRRAKG